MHERRVLVVYPSNPEQLGQTLKEAAQQASTLSSILIEPWEQLDIPGRFIIDGVLEAIDDSEFILADITRLNFNVTYEIGYAIGKGKRIFLTMNSALSPAKKEIGQLGIYDTLGYIEYENTNELRQHLL